MDRIRQSCLSLANMTVDETFGWWWWWSSSASSLTWALRNTLLIVVTAKLDEGILSEVAKVMGQSSMSRNKKGLVERRVHNTGHEPGRKRYGGGSDKVRLGIAMDLGKASHLELA